MQTQFHFRHWRTVSALYGTAVTNHTRVQFGRAATVAVDIARLHHAAEQLHHQDVTIMDQGVLQQIIRYLEAAPEAIDLARTVVERERRQLAGIGVDWFHLVIDTSAEIAAERITHRQESIGEFDRMMADRRIKALRRTYDTQRLVLQALGVGRTSIAVVDGSRPLEDVTREAAHIVASVIAGDRFG